MYINHKARLPYKDMDKPITIKDVVRVHSKKLKVGDVFTFFDPRLILPSFYILVREEDFQSRVYKVVPLVEEERV